MVDHGAADGHVGDRRAVAAAKHAGRQGLVPRIAQQEERALGGHDVEQQIDDACQDLLDGLDGHERPRDVAEQSQQTATASIAPRSPVAGRPSEIHLPPIRLPALTLGRARAESVSSWLGNGTHGVDARRPRRGNACRLDAAVHGAVAGCRCARRSCLCGVRQCSRERIDLPDDRVRFLEHLVSIRQELRLLDVTNQGELEVAEHEPVAGGEFLFSRDRRAVDDRAEGAAGVAHEHTAGLETDACVLARDGRRADDDIARGRAPDERRAVAKLVCARLSRLDKRQREHATWRPCAERRSRPSVRSVLRARRWRASPAPRCRSEAR